MVAKFLTMRSLMVTILLDVRDSEILLIARSVRTGTHACQREFVFTITKGKKRDTSKKNKPKTTTTIIRSQLQERAHNSLTQNL